MRQVLAHASLLLACGLLLSCGEDVPPVDPPGTGAGEIPGPDAADLADGPLRLRGVMAGPLGESGVVELSVKGEPDEGVERPAAGSLRLADGRTLWPVLGTFVRSAAIATSLEIPGYALGSGQAPRADRDRLVAGAYEGPNGAGEFVLLPRDPGVEVYCGRVRAGPLLLAISSAGLVGAVVSDVRAARTQVLTGTTTGAQVRAGVLGGGLDLLGVREGTRVEGTLVDEPFELAAEACP